MKTILPLILLAACLFLTGCDGVVVRTYNSYAAASGKAEDVPSGSERVPVQTSAEIPPVPAYVPTFECGSAIYIVEITEDASQPWFQVLTLQHRLPTLRPLLRTLINYSHCFINANPDRHRELSWMGKRQTKEDLALHGDLGNSEAPHFTLSPSVNFTATDQIESVTMTLVDANSHELVETITGTLSNHAFSFDQLAKTRQIQGMEAWQSSPQGQVIADAFMNAWPELTSVAMHHGIQRSDAMGQAQGYAALLMPVRQAQVRLAELNFYSGAIDGVASPAVTEALRAFQRAKGLPITGRLDYDSTAALTR